MDVIPSAQRFLSEGNAQAAVDCLEKISQSSGLDLDGHLLMAEALWTQAGPGGTEAALPHYEEAAALAGAGSDVSKKATVSLGHGFALLQLVLRDAASCSCLVVPGIMRACHGVASSQQRSNGFRGFWL